MAATSARPRPDDHETMASSAVAANEYRSNGSPATRSHTCGHGSDMAANVARPRLGPNLRQGRVSTVTLEASSVAPNGEVSKSPVRTIVAMRS